MLVLKRKIQEDVLIFVGDTVIEVKVVDAFGDGAKLGITAPKSVTVHRREVAESIAQAQANASEPVTGER